VGALDDLLKAWRKNPDADSTVALCTYVGASGQEALVREIGTTAEQWHARDATVMLSVGRMYLDASLLPEAQASLVAAGKADASNPKPYRYLGEVLLRRGDALRAEKVLARAIQLGLDDGETAHWHDRATFYMALQKRVGAPAVAAEVARALPKVLSIPAPQIRPEPFEEPTNPRAQSFGSAEEISQVEELPATTQQVVPQVPQHSRNVRARTMIGVAPPAGGVAPGGRVLLQGQGARAAASAAQSRSPVQAPARGQIQVARAAAPARTLPSPPPPRPERDDATERYVHADMLSVGAQAVDDDDEDATQIARIAFDAPTRPAAARSSAPAVSRTGSAAAARVASTAMAHAAKLPALAAPPVASPRPAPALVPPLPAAPAAAARAPLVVPAAPNTRPTQPEPFPAFVEESSHERDSVDETARYEFEPLDAEAGPPSPNVLFEHLARVGMFEPAGGAAPAWEQAPVQRARGNWVLLTACVLLSAAGVGGWQYARQIKAERATRAAVLTDQIERMLENGDPAELKATDQKLSEAFDLDSRSRRAGRLWLENRVLRALMLNEESRGIDSAIFRGREVGLTEKEMAFGRMAAFLVEGDLAGAAAQLPKWDKEAGHDAMYQLAAGAVLERAGDLRAIERYEAARSLDPKLVAADILLARLALLELGKDRAAPAIESLKSKVGDAPSVRALKALAWVIDPARGDEPPADAKLGPDDAAKLPAPLLCVPPMLDAARAVRAGDHEKLARSLDQAIRTADSPALAAGLGFLAIEAGDETLARKAALRAVSFAALYPRARTLAARVALLGGRIDEAEKAVEQLDPTSADVAVVRAVAAYESLEPADVDAALKVLGDAQSSHTFSALAAGSGVLLGTKYPAPADLGALRDPSVPWGEIVALDAMLDQGDLAGAQSVLAGRTGDALRPVHLSRLARLHRYQGKAAEAASDSARALEGNVTAPLLVERTYDLVAADDTAGARTLIAKYPVVLGPLSGWLAAYVDAHAKDKNEQAQAVARVAKLDLPPDASPLAIRVLALRALAVTGDKRARPYLAVVARRAGKHPDVQLAIKDM
jgi:predicted negative regulator of RcsB-dependent stress response